MAETLAVWGEQGLTSEAVKNVTQSVAMSNQRIATAYVQHLNHTHMSTATLELAVAPLFFTRSGSDYQSHIHV